MFTQYPHTVTITDKSFVAGSTTVVRTLKGRKRPITTNRLVDFNGQQVAVKWIVYFPLPIEEIKLNAEVEVTDSNGTLLLSGIVKQFSEGLLNARIWI